MPPSRIYFNSVRNGREEVFRMNVDGTGQQCLVPVPKQKHDRVSHANPFGYNYAHVTSVSPDGARIVYTVSTRNGARKDLYLMNADGGQQRFVTEGENATFSADGRILEYILGGQAFSINIDGSGKQPSVIDPRKLADIGATSPDGKTRVRVIALQQGYFGIYLLDRQDRPDRLISREHSMIMHVSFSPDGKKLAYDLLPDEDEGDIYTINLNGSDRKLLTQSHHNWCPVWGLIPGQKR